MTDGEKALLRSAALESDEAELVALIAAVMRIAPGTVKAFRLLLIVLLRAG